jgi:hypothetical protein
MSRTVRLPVKGNRSKPNKETHKRSVHISQILFFGEYVKRRRNLYWSHLENIYDGQRKPTRCLCRTSLCKSIAMYIGTHSLNGLQHTKRNITKRVHTVTDVLDWNDSSHSITGELYRFHEQIYERRSLAAGEQIRTSVSVVLQELL